MNKRTIINLQDTLLDQLSEMAENAHISRSELIRQALQTYLEQQAPKAAPNVFGLWKNKRVDGLAFQNKQRSEWD